MGGVGIIQFPEGLNRLNWQRKDIFALWLELGHPSFSALRHWDSWFLDLQIWTGIYTVSSPGLRPLERD